MTCYGIPPSNHACYCTIPSMGGSCYGCPNAPTPWMPPPFCPYQPVHVPPWDQRNRTTIDEFLAKIEKLKKEDGA